MKKRFWKRGFEHHEKLVKLAVLDWILFSLVSPWKVAIHAFIKVIEILPEIVVIFLVKPLSSVVQENWVTSKFGNGQHNKIELTFKQFVEAWQIPNLFRLDQKKQIRLNNIFILHWFWKYIPYALKWYAYHWKFSLVALQPS